jgi:chromosome segregation ATPase
MTDIQALEDQLAAARAEADRHNAAFDTVFNKAKEAKRKAAEQERIAQGPRLFGLFRTHQAREAAEKAQAYRAEVTGHQDRVQELTDPSMEANRTVRDLEQQIADAQEEADRVGYAELDRELWRDGMAVQRVHDAVESDQMSYEEAYENDGTVRREAYDRELRALEVADGLGEDPWGPYPDISDDDQNDGYAEAAADARADQLAVRDLDLSIDAGARTYEEVYTPEGHIRADLLHDEEPEQEMERPAPEQSQEPDPAREREPRGFDIEEPF